MSDAPNQHDLSQPQHDWKVKHEIGTVLVRELPPDISIGLCDQITHKIFEAIGPYLKQE